MLKNLKFLFMPSYWLMNAKYCPLHDKALVRLLDRYELVIVDRYYAKLGNHTIWIANMPYAVGILDLQSHSRPSRNTILRLEQATKFHMDREKKKRRDRLKKNLEFLYQ